MKNSEYIELCGLITEIAQAAYNANLGWLVRIPTGELLDDLYGRLLEAAVGLEEVYQQGTHIPAKSQLYFRKQLTRHLKELRSNIEPLMKEIGRHLREFRYKIEPILAEVDEETILL